MHTVSEIYRTDKNHPDKCAFSVTRPGKHAITTFIEVRRFHSREAAEAARRQLVEVRYATDDQERQLTDIMADESYASASVVIDQATGNMTITTDTGDEYVVSPDGELVP
jgi:hypothetical protein